MSWKETSIMDQKVQLISDWMNGEYYIMELSEIYNISRPTVYKWISRYKKNGISGLEELSKAPIHHPNQTPEKLMKEIVEAKQRKQKWGPKKIRVLLETEQPDKNWPSSSTIGLILDRNGLVRRRKIRRKTPPYTEPFKSCDKPNKVWSADYKGQFKTGDTQLCYPLTITDNMSRYLLRCHGLKHPSYIATKPWFEWTFREYGLPDAIRTDNGSPFASVSLGGLSKLSIWFIKLGIIPERIDRGHPEQNGRHERMHRTLKEYTAKPPKATMKAQQEAFDEFQYEYNYERPHEALGQKPPASVYCSSQRKYPARVPRVEYDEGLEVRQVRKNGEIKFKGEFIYISESLSGEPISLQQTDDDLWKIFFSFKTLGFLNTQTGLIKRIEN